MITEICTGGASQKFIFLVLGVLAHMRTMAHRCAFWETGSCCEIENLCTPSPKPELVEQ